MLPALALFALLSQSAPNSAPPKFDVVSIEPLAPDQAPIPLPRGWTPFKPGGEYSDPNITVFGLLLAAYDVNFLQLDVRVLPDWAKTTHYSIDAKPASGFPDLPPDENRKQIGRMLQTMLANRFHLVVHHESRPTPVYEVTLAGKNIKSATPGDPSQPPTGGTVADDSYGGRLSYRNIPIGTFVDLIGKIMGRQAVDKTGLAGVFNIDVRWQGSGEAANPQSGGCSQDCQSLMIGALSDQLGIKLHATTLSEDLLIVDHIEKPTAN